MSDRATPFGARLRALRETAALSQEELAERAGISAQAVAALETGKRRRPYPATVRALADALDLDAAAREALAALVTGRATVPPPPSSVIAPPTPLVGRDGDLDALAALLDVPAHRLVTVIGPGGVGKTHLALALAARMRDRYADGVTVVPLGPLHDPALVVPAIARAVGLREAAGQAPLDLLAGWYHQRRALLVLDNAEHLLEIAPDLATLLARCPHVTMLVTSRTPLHVRGERVYPLAPLPVPALDRVPSAADAAAAPAVRLLLDRARAMAPGFALTDSNAAAIVAICRRLDGLPLALELIAPWLMVLPPTALLARLDRALPLLADGPRDLPERQRTMHETIAWSYRLLDAPASALFRRLAVFAGGASLAAIEALHDQLGQDAREWMPALATLVDRSLLRLDAADDSAPRYSMLETIREFGLEQLDASDEGAAVRDAQAAWALALATRAGATLEQRLDHALLADVTAELPNLRAALTRFAEQGDSDALMRLVGSMLFPWYLTGHLREGYDWAERALALRPAEASPARARAAIAAGHLAHYLGDDIVAVARLDEAIAIARATGDHWVAGFGALMRGIIAEDAGDYAAAAGHLREAQAPLQRAHNARGLMLTTFHLGVVARGQRDAETARRHFDAALTRSRDSEDGLIEAWCLEWLTVLATEAGDHAAAGRMLAARLAIPLGEASMPRDGQLMATAAVLGASVGASAAAARLMGATEGLLATSGDSFRLPEREIYVQTVARLERDLGPERYRELTAAGHAMPDTAIMAELRAVIAASTATAAEPNG